MSLFHKERWSPYLVGTPTTMVCASDAIVATAAPGLSILELWEGRRRRSA